MKIIDQKFLTIAIDGGAATGKSSTSRGIAGKLNFLHIDTGYHYRLITFILLSKNITPSDIKEISDFLSRITVSTREDKGSGVLSVKLYEFVTMDDLKSNKVNEYVSLYAAIPEIRGFLLDYQRTLPEFAAVNGYRGIIMEGRDIGTVVLPDADFKFFLQADAEIRNFRRQKEGIVDEIQKRDIKDSSRTIAPLKPASDAIIIDNSNMTLENTINFICLKIFPNNS